MAYAQHSTLPAYTLAVWVDGKTLPGVGPLWSGKKEPPAIGDVIRINFNGLGEATVTGYFTEDEWLGVLCKLHNPPEWHKRQNKGPHAAHIFGAEISSPV